MLAAMASAAPLPFRRDTTVLITGGAGFIGSHLAEHLRGKARVRVLDNLRTGSLENLAGMEAEFVRGSILDCACVREAMAGVEYVFHLAAMVSLPESLAHPAECARINVEGLRIVLEEAAAAGVRKLCFNSSASVYGNDPAVPKMEAMPARPMSPCAETKLAGEELCARFHDSGRLQTAALRFFNVFGPRQDPDSTYAASVPIFIRQALANLPLTVHGDGGQTRDFLFVQDAAAVLAFTATHPELSGVINAGSGNGTTVLELARLIIGATASRSPILHAPQRAADVRHSVASVEKLARAGFKPAWSLRDGLASTLRFFPAPQLA